LQNLKTFYAGRFYKRKEVVMKNFKILIFFVILLTFFYHLNALTRQNEKDLGPNTSVNYQSIDHSQKICPVMGGKINKSHYADVKGKRIYVCCPGCISTIKANPEKYIKELESKNIILDKTP
jgi:YHS domain-containing protein